MSHAKYFQRGDTMDERTFMLDNTLFKCLWEMLGLKMNQYYKVTELSQLIKGKVQKICMYMYILALKTI